MASARSSIRKGYWPRSLLCAEGGLRFPLGRVHRFGKLFQLEYFSHSPAAAPGGGLYQQRKADLFRRIVRFFLGNLF